MSLLFRRREVWVPTPWGALLIGVLAWAAGIGVARQLGDFLAVSEPALGRGGRPAHTLVVEGWLEGEDLDRAATVFARGAYERVLTTGGPIEYGLESRVFGNFAQRAAADLQAKGIGVDRVVAVPAPRTRLDRTHASAVALGAWLHAHDPAARAIDLYTGNVHARRSALVYRMALEPAVTVGVLASPALGFDLRRWWASSEGTKAVLGETISWAWTKCCFWPMTQRVEAAPEQGR